MMRSLLANAIQYSPAGTRVTTCVREDTGGFLVRICDQGPGIDDNKLAEIFAGTYKSQRGMGKGLVAVKKLVGLWAG